MEAEQLVKIRDRKLKIAKDDHRVSTQVIEMLTRLKALCEPADERVITLSLMNPQIRRQQKAAGAIVFWQDEDAVRNWLGGADLHDYQKFHNKQNQ